MVTTCLIIAAFFTVLLAGFCGYIGFQLITRGGFWNCFNGQQCFESAAKLIGVVLVAIFQAIGDSNR